MFAMFQPPRRKPAVEGRVGASAARKERFRQGTAMTEAVSPAVRQSLLARSGRAGAIRLKENEVARLLLEAPEIVQRHEELLVALRFSEPSLDRLRNELLNLASSGSRLESQRLKDHLVRAGMSPLLERLSVSRIPSGLAVGDCDAAHGGGAEDFELRFLRAAAQLQEMAELEPERKRAVERFNSEATEENWRDAQRLIAPRAARGDREPA